MSKLDGLLRYFLLYKPYGMLSQFSKETAEQLTLADLSYNFPIDVYPVGRLDKDSEGLLLLTNDKKLNQALLAPSNKQPKTYLVQVEGKLTSIALEQLKKGVEITIQKKKYLTKQAKVKQVSPPTDLPERDPPIRYRKNIPDSWAEISIKEGKNRQIRRMFAKVGFPVLRLVRIKIAGLVATNMKPGQIKEIKIGDLLL